MQSQLPPRTLTNSVDNSRQSKTQKDVWDLLCDILARSSVFSALLKLYKYA